MNGRMNLRQAFLSVWVVACVARSEGYRVMKMLFILMDSLNRHYLNLYGQGWVKTPNLDRLAARGTVF